MRYILNTLNWNSKELTFLRMKNLDFEDVSDISLENISRIKKRYGSIQGISTPFTTGGFGMKANTALFYKCMLLLEESFGFKIFNFPVLDVAIKDLRIKWCKKNNVDYCEPIFSIIYRRIFEFGDFSFIYRTEVWESSDGCKREEELFQEFKIDVLEFPHYSFMKFIEELKIPVKHLEVA